MHARQQQQIIDHDFVVATDVKAKAILQERRALAELSAWKALPHTCAALAAVVEPLHVSLGGPAEASNPNIAQLQRQWRQRHVGLSDRRKLRNPAPNTKPCWSSGCCICRGAGLRTHRLWVKARKFLKDKLRSEDDQAKLSSGHVVLLFSQTDPDIDGQWCICIAQVALQYYKPWRPTLLLLDPADSAERLKLLTVLHDRNEPPGFFVDLKAKKQDNKLQFATPHDMVAALNPSLPFDVAIMVLSQQLSPYVQPPGHVRARMLHRLEQVWLGLEAESRARRAERSGGIAAMMLDALSVEGLQVDVNDEVDVGEVGIDEDEVATLEEDLGNFSDDEDNNEDISEELDDDVDDMMPLLQEAWSITQDVTQSDSSSNDDASSTSENEPDPPQVPAVPSVPGAVVDEPSVLEQPPVAPDVGQPDAEPQVAVADTQSRQVRPETFEFGRFRITFRPPNSWQALCRYHAAHEKTRCTKAGTVSSTTSREEVIKKLKLWCLSATSFETREGHMGPRGLPHFNASDLAKDDAELAALEAAMPPLP